MKKKIAAAFMALCLAAGLMACGSSQGTAGTAAKTTEAASAGTAGGTASGNPLEVVIWDNNQQPGIQEICDEFTKSSGIPVKVEVKDWNSYWTYLESSATAGNMPDVFWMHSNNSQMYMKNGILLKLDDYVKKSDKVSFDNFMPEITELYTYNNAHYAIPKDYDTIALWYNKTMFDAAGIKYPDATWTWDDFYEAAKKLTKPDGSQYGYCVNPSNNQDSYYNTVYSMGGKIVSDDHKTSGYDDPNTLKAMDFIGKVVKDCCPDPKTMSETGTDVMLSSGKVAMITQGSWMTAGFLKNDYITKNCDVAILPYDKTTGIRASMCNGLGWAASAKSKRPDDCWKLMEWFGSKDMQLKQAQLGVTMSAYLNTSDAWVKCTDVFHLQPYLDMTTEKTGDAANKLILRPYSYNTSVWESMAQEKLVNAWADPAKMDDVCKEVALEMNKDIASENK